MNARRPHPSDSSRPASRAVSRGWPTLWLTLALALLLAPPPGQGATPKADGDAPAHRLADGGPSHQALPADPGPGGPRRHHHGDDQDPPPAPPALPVAAASPLPPALSPAPFVTRSASLSGRRCRSPGAPRAPPL